MKRQIFIILVLLSVIMACSKKSTKHDELMYSISGTILNQCEEPAPDLTVTVTDSKDITYSDTTDQDGKYLIAKINPGETAVTLSSTEYAYLDIPRYLDKDYVYNLLGDSVIDMSVREFNLVFHDTGNAVDQWLMYGGVTYDGQQFVFENDSLEEDYMFSPLLPIPTTADSSNLYILIRGKSAPVGTSNMNLYIYVDNVPQNLYWSNPYSSMWRYHMYSLEQFAQVRGHNLRFCLYFVEDLAPFIYVDDIMVFNF